MGIRADPLWAAELVARAYAIEPASQIAEVARGAMGRVWRLRTRDSAYAVKELFWVTTDDLASGAAEDDVRVEVAFRDAAVASGIVAPVDRRTVQGNFLYVLPTGFGSELPELPELPPDSPAKLSATLPTELPDGLAGTVVRVASWAAGKPAAIDSPGRASWIGGTLARLHTLNVPAGDRPLDAWSTTPPGTERWYEIAARATAAGVAWADPFRQRIPHYLERATHVTAIDRAGMLLSHTDLQPQNVLVDDRGRYTLLDWQIEPQHPSTGLASILLDWHVHDEVVDDDGVRETLAAYHDNGGTAELADLSAFASLFAGSLNYVAEQAELALDETASPEHRTHADQVVAKLLSDPAPTLEAYERIIQLCQGN